MNKLTYLCTSKNGKKILYDPVDSHVSTHFEDTDNLKELAIEILEEYELEGDVDSKEHEIDRVVGLSDVVGVDETDEIVYAIRKNREDQGRVPFTKSRKQAQSSKVSTYLVKMDERSYELSSAWIGELDSPPFPEMTSATADSVPFWSKNAFVWGSQEIIEGSEVNVCPW